MAPQPISRSVSVTDTKNLGRSTMIAQPYGDFLSGSGITNTHPKNRAMDYWKFHALAANVADDSTKRFRKATTSFGTPSVKSSFGDFGKYSMSKTRPGREDFVTHKGDKMYNRDGHYQHHAQGTDYYGRPY